MAETLTAGELDITDRELEALIWVRNALDPDIPDTNLPDWMRFDMNSWGDISEVGDSGCGTAFCIGGSMVARIIRMTEAVPQDFTADDDRRFDHVSGTYSSALYPLFFKYPGRSATDRRGATAAIDQFLTGNVDDPWLVKMRQS